MTNGPWRAFFRVLSLEQFALSQNGPVGREGTSDLKSYA